MVLFQAAGWMKARRNLRARLRIGIDGCSSTVRGPAFKKCFASRDPRLRIEFYPFGCGIDGAPALWSEFAQGIIFCCKPLQVKNQVTFLGSCFLVAMRDGNRSDLIGNSRRKRPSAAKTR